MTSARFPQLPPLRLTTKSLSVLSDFEEFAVYDCRLKPTTSTAPHRPHPFTFPTPTTLSDGRKSPAIFSRDASSKAPSTNSPIHPGKAAPPTLTTVPQTIETWRADLAANLAFATRSFPARINFAVSDH